MLSHFKRRLGVLAAVAVLAAMVPAITSTPVSAAPATVPITALTIGSAAVYKACPTGAASAAGFTDTTSTAVDCLKMFGITTGTTATTYSPDDSVTRWAMALFLTRALGPAGGTLGTGADQGFTDITGKSAEIQTAINQIKQLGITTGKTATTFAPDDNVTREEMALFIERFLTNSIAGPGGQSDADGAVISTATTWVTSDCGGVTACTGKYNYTDVDSGSVTVEGANAIKELYDMGIHDGVSATTFNPGSDMTRAAMATFLELALDHTNARPAGLWLQASLYTNAGAHTPTLSATDRSATFGANADIPVDVFYWTTSTTEGNAAFLATGLCDDSVATGAAITKCYIDTGEPQTNANGNVVPTAVQTDPYLTVYQGSDVYYAWTAAAATTYDNDLHGETANADDHSSITVAATAAATDIRCTMDTPANAQVTTHNHKIKAGATVTVTCQVKDGALATSGNVAKAAQYVQLNQSREFNLDSTGSQTGNTILVNETLSYTDATGAVSFTIAGPVDADGTGVSGYNDDWIDTIIVTCVSVASSLTTCNNAGTVSGYSGFMTDSGAYMTFILTYDDDAAAAATSALTSTATSGVASVLGVTRTYTATVYDQYGDVVAGNAGTFASSSDLPKGALCTVATPSVCTIANHGLSVGDDLTITSLGSFTGGDMVTDAVVNAVTDLGATATTGSAYLVGTVPSVNTFTMNSVLADGTEGTSLRGRMVDTLTEGTASVAATPLVLLASSTAVASRTTTTDGTASYSWTDTEGTSGRDLVTWTPTTASVKTKTYFRLATAASFLETGDGDAVLEDTETIGKLVEWDTTNDDYIVQVATNTVATDATLTYYQYNYDSNDQFGHTGTVAAPSGTATTMALFEYYVGLANTASLGLGAYGDIQGVQNYQALSTGTSQHWDG